MKRTILAAVVLLATAGAAMGQTAMDLHQRCGNGFTAGVLNRSYCHSYITGIANGLIQSGSRLVCPPSGVTDTQAVMIVQNYMRAHPEELSEPANTIIQAALSQAFPCPTVVQQLTGQAPTPSSPSSDGASSYSNDDPPNSSGQLPQWLVSGGTIGLAVVGGILLIALIAGAVALAKAAIRAAVR